LGGKVELLGAFHGQNLHHNPRKLGKREPVKGSSEALLDDTNVSLCFWDMFLGIGVVDTTNAKLVGEWVHEGLKLVVTVDGLDGESNMVDTKHCLQSTPVRFACLIGNWEGVVQFCT
jgi:hypothetical protein